MTIHSTSMKQTWPRPIVVERGELDTHRSVSAQGPLLRMLEHAPEKLTDISGTCSNLLNLRIFCLI
jgi:hypothetical protein